MAKIIGYVNCTDCGSYTHITDPNKITLYFHPDDASVAEVECHVCKGTVVSKIAWDHARNFMIHGVKCLSVSDRHEALTEEAIDEWDVAEELDTFFNET